MAFDTTCVSKGQFEHRGHMVSGGKELKQVLAGRMALRHLKPRGVQLLKQLKVPGHKAGLGELPLGSATAKFYL